ncbi:L-threonylcarbamoyladenylate synthase [Tissierella sp. Yu-01]|uniref:L-threonylcarbamoyladenylate synthase n=1 Tax=Tissierella sp. Yu-01 TaxID=3035694 RepID=UPI00240DAAE6|nr:L-threonylcarbamoyladenylate synthase [Tissierella sp. Yu-01]WFA08683.1 L-threonylcarbamoyladenylate synthase [Tissierella sp. Yu-01]
MNTKVLEIDKDNIDKGSIIEAANMIRAGKLVAFPTETVYGLGADGLNKTAVKGIFQAKGRPQDNPLILHIHSIEQIFPLVKEIPELTYECMKKFWPGPLTILFKKSELVPDIITAGLDTVAIRMPDHPIAVELLRESNTPIAAPSANLSGKPSPTNAEHVIEDLTGKVDMIIDGGDTGVGLESTVLDVSGNCPMILRPGGVTLEDLREIIPDIIQDLGTIKEDEKIVPKSPGQKYRHYAPKADMFVYTGKIDSIVDKIKEQANLLIKEGKKVGIMATEETKDNYIQGTVLVVGSRENKNTIATNLFKTIRLFDDNNVDVILAEGVETDHIGTAIMNRMMKASSGKIKKI